MKFDKPYPIREILLIQSLNSSHIKDWQHPLIKDLIEEYCTPSELNEGYYDGPFVRAIYQNVIVVALLEEYAYEKFLEGCEQKNQSFLNVFGDETLHEYIATMLLEDVWVPKDEQFCFTEYGKKLSKVFSYDVPYELITPDLGLRLDDDKDPNSNWGYCT